MLLGCSGPTLPLPPPNALVEAPDETGRVTLHVEAVEPGALVMALNSRTREGVIGTASDAGEAQLQLPAEIGDRIEVWQRIDTETSEVTTVRVPAPRGRDAGAGPADGG